MDIMTITKAQLQAALLQWERDARDGKTISHEETERMPAETVTLERV